MNTIEKISDIWMLKIMPIIISISLLLSMGFLMWLMISAATDSNLFKGCQCPKQAINHNDYSEHK